jgi:hypothetical protein
MFVETARESTLSSSCHKLRNSGWQWAEAGK